MGKENKIILRSLKVKDAELMLEWMHDESVVTHLYADFLNKTLSDCIEFITLSGNDKTNLNLAITDSSDEYLGTVSLKHIDYEKQAAEFAICIRKKAMGKGIAIEAMQKIFKIAYERGIINIYWCVNRENKRAIKFYMKNGFMQSEKKTYMRSPYCSSDLLWFEYCLQFRIDKNSSY